MNRRRALQSLTILPFVLGGCLDHRRFLGASERTDRRDTSGERRAVSVCAASSDALAAMDLTPSVEAVRPAVTDAHTAEIAISLANRDDESRTLQIDRCPPADVHVATRTDGTAMLALLLADEQSFEPATPECWRPHLQDFQVGEPCGAEELTIPAGETATRTYEVWDHPKNEACMPPGSYEFGETYVIDGGESEWRFMLAIESA